MTNIHLTGQLPPNWDRALRELEGDLGLAVAQKGIPVHCQKGDHLAVSSDGTAVNLIWDTPVAFYRALSRIPQPLTPCEISEQARFETAGIMFDCSRNAVLKPEAIRLLLRKMALMGLNLGMMYTEDTYEVPEQPFFGYKRGRYSYAEMKALDDYADLFGIELCPCIQTLGHLKRALHWPAFHHLRDNEHVLLADQEETYVVLEQMIRAASAPFRSRRIHLGMDEAYGVGLGEHLHRFGYENPHSIMGRHLSRVLEITDKYGLDAMMWSDMYFQLDGNHYHIGGYPSEAAKAAVAPRVTLVYWDYYQNDEARYAQALDKHARFPAPTVFAGGIWTWVGPAPAYETAIVNSVAGLNAAMKANIPLVFATAWGDNGAETNITAALLAMQLYGEMNYTGVYDEQALYDRFRRVCHADARAFRDLGLLNIVPGMTERPDNPANVCKYMLYQDPLIQLFEADMAPFDLPGHFDSLVNKYARYARENPEFRLLFDFYTALAHALALKCRWHERAGEIVRTGNREAAAALAEDIPATVEALHALRSIWRKLWESTNKPHGFEVIEVRLAGVAARMGTAGEKMQEFAAGRVDTIPELAEPCLVTKLCPDHSMDYTNVMEEIATTSTIDW